MSNVNHPWCVDDVTLDLLISFVFVVILMNRQDQLDLEEK